MRPFKRIGSYPTAALTVNRVFTPPIPALRLNAGWHLDIKAEFNYVVGMHNVRFTFGADFARRASSSG